MTNRITTLVAAAALFIDFSAPASAETTHFQTLGHWKISATKTWCSAETPFRDGTFLEFTLNVKGALLVSVINPEWSINKGDDYEVVMQVDRAPAGTFKAHGEDKWVMWQIPPTEASFNLLSYGRTLTVRVGRQVLAYDLALSEAAIKALGRCIAPRMEEANPFSDAAPQASAPPSDPFAETTSNPYRRM